MRTSRGSGLAGGAVVRSGESTVGAESAASPARPGRPLGSETAPWFSFWDPPPDGGTQPRAEEYPACSRRFALGARPRLSRPRKQRRGRSPCLARQTVPPARGRRKAMRRAWRVRAREARLPADTRARPIARPVWQPDTRDNRGPKEAQMSTLVAIAYPDAATAERVRAELVQATKEHLVQLEDAVVVEHQPDGKIK